jgi:signal transduction histidine kinase
VRVSALPTREKAGGIAGLLVLTDITAQVATLKMRRDFFSNASHELRTPLTSILGYLESLEDSLPADSPLRGQYVDVLQRQAERMRRIIDDLLLLARVESEQWPVQAERYDLVAQATSLLESFQPAARKSHQELVADLPPEPVWVSADREKLHVVLSNLIDNALKYSGQGARVRLTIAPEASAVEVAVADNGPGIPPAELSRIFERFYRVDKSRSRQLGGTGLGLAIVRHILAAHHVEIEVESNLGEGARFHFRLPRAAD